MKCIQTIIRPEKETEVIQQLEKAGVSALTKWDVLGRGRQRGIQVGSALYNELPKVCLMLMVPDEQVQSAVGVILESARTGHPGDGRIFVSDVKSAYTIRTGRPDPNPA